MLLFSNMFVEYVSPCGPMCLRCLMLTLSGPVELFFFLCFIAAWTCVVFYVDCLPFEYFPIYVSVCFVCFMFDCVAELLIECVC